jgi:hypothetical protein
MPARWPVSRAEPLGVGLLLAALAIAAPLQLYLVALALFGLPHVLWEMHWLRQTYRHCLPLRGWLALGAILLLQALARLGSWAKGVPAQTTMVVDLLSLALLAFLAFAATALVSGPGGGPRRWLGAFVAVAAGVGLIAAVDAGSVTGVLVLLAVTHNFTPWALTPPDRRLGDTPVRPTIARLFALPWLVVALLLVLGPLLPAMADLPGRPQGMLLWMPGEAAWLQHYLSGGSEAILSGLVLSQCLHYYCVMRLFPATLERRTTGSSRRWQPWALGASAALTLYFMHDFVAARQLYAVAAGAHAWLELPLMLILLSGVGPPQSQSQSHPPSSATPGASIRE